MSELDLLKSLYNNNSLPHALIFHGNSKSTANDFANFLNPNPHSNILEFDKLNIDESRNIKDFLSKTSTGYKVVIINANKLSPEVQNSLLKTLEEPTSKTLLILKLDNIHNILDTIRSRCQVLRFYNKEYSFKGEKYFDDITKLISSDNIVKFKFAKDFIDKENDLLEFIESVESYFRVLLLNSIGMENRVDIGYNQDTKDCLEKINIIINLKKYLSGNVDKKLFLENLLLNI